MASNHLSYLDPVAVGVACPHKLNFMGRHDLFSNRFFSWLLTGVGVFPVKRDTADLSALKEAMQRVKGGGGLVLFPEGRRLEPGGKPGKPQPGIGFLAAKLNVPVIPAFIKGTEKILPKGSKFIRPHRVSVCFGRHIDIEKDLSYEDIAQKIMESVYSLKNSCKGGN